jgi:hypothetical protein
MKIKEVRRVVRALLKIPIDRPNMYARMALAQDTLEFAAMLLGAKQVFLLGRGFDDQTWVSAVKNAAAKLGVAVIREDAYWNPDYSKLDVPAWYRELRLSRQRAIYISAVSGVVTEIREISARGWVSPDEEARLLGYPLCCVADHHRRALVMADAFFRGAMLAANGDEAEARRIILADVKFKLEGEPAARMKEATELRPGRFTSVDMCVECAANGRGPAHALSKQYAKLAKGLDQALFEELEQVWTWADPPASERNA